MLDRLSSLTRQHLVELTICGSPLRIACRAGPVVPGRSEPAIISITSPVDMGVYAYFQPSAGIAGAWTLGIRRRLCVAGAVMGSVVVALIMVFLIVRLLRR